MRRQVQDDLAKWEMNAAGDPEAQADSRSRAHEFAKILKASTPLVIPGCRITKSFEAGSQEHPYVPCPHCKEMQVLDWENMLSNLDPEHPEKACFNCVACGVEIHEHHRPAMLARLEFRAHNPAALRSHRSFWIWSAYSVLQSFERIAREWLKAKRDSAAEQTFLNDTAGKAYKAVLKELRTKARKQGLWLPFFPVEHGGMGLGPLANALVQMELGHSHLGALSMNSQGPDDATMLTLLAHGTDFQKEKYLKPLINGEKRICYSMTEKAAGADATGMQTTAVKDGKGNYVLNGEKWFSSAATAADIAVVMAKTNPEAPRHQQYSTFIVELPNPGYRIIRDIPTMAVHGKHYTEMGGGHAEVAIENLIVPEENLLGGEGMGFAMGQHRLAYGRLRHGMHNVAMAQRALDLATEHVTKRTTFGKGLEDRQGVQFMLADCASKIYIARLMLMHIAYKAENGMDIRQENGMAKVFLANMVHKVVDTAIQLHGALGYSLDTPLAAWYTHIRSQRLVDGPDEVHKWITGKNVIRAFKKDGTTAAAAGGDLL